MGAEGSQPAATTTTLGWLAGRLCYTCANTVPCCGWGLNVAKAPRPPVVRHCVCHHVGCVGRYARTMCKQHCCLGKV